MVRHQTISVERATRLREQAPQVEQIKSAIAVLKKAALTIVTAVRYVNWKAGKHDAGAAGHSTLTTTAIRR